MAAVKDGKKYLDAAELVACEPGINGSRRSVERTISVGCRGRIFLPGSDQERQSKVHSRRKNILSRHRPAKLWQRGRIRQEIGILVALHAPARPIPSLARRQRAHAA